jgi:hypothetical protein
MKKWTEWPRRKKESLVRWHTCILHQLFNGSNVHKFFLMVRISVFSFVQVEFFRGPTLSLSNDSVLLLQTVFINVKKKIPFVSALLLPPSSLSPLSPINSPTISSVLVRTPNSTTFLPPAQPASPPATGRDDPRAGRPSFRPCVRSPPSKPLFGWARRV